VIHKAKVAVCSEIRTKHSTQSENNVEFMGDKPGVSKETAWLKKGILVRNELR
jgi:hypothetical protein